MKAYEYKVVSLTAPGIDIRDFPSGLPTQELRGAVDAKEAEIWDAHWQNLNDIGRDGWEAVGPIVSTMKIVGTSYEYKNLLFKRELGT